MENSTEVLVSIETVKIKDFIFNTNKLRIIRGASYLLDYLNQFVVKNMIEEKVSKDDILYIGAGNAKFFTTKEKADEIISQVKDVYHRYAPGSKLATAYIEIDKSSNEKVWDLLDRLGRETAIQKSKGFPMLNLDNPFIDKCFICNDKPSEWRQDDSDDLIQELNGLYNSKINKGKVIGKVFKGHDNNGICRECLAKLIASTYIKKDGDEAKISFYHKVFEEIDDYKLVDELEEFKDSKSHIGFMYADGDGLGVFLGGIKESFVNSGGSDEDEKEYRRFMSEFSEVLDKSTKDSLIETLKLYRSEDGKHGEFFIVGGDDVCGVFPADKVLGISTTFQKIFEEKMKKFIDKHQGRVDKHQNITASSGVVIAKAKTPIHYLFDQSLGLQKNAKAKRTTDLKGCKDYKTGYVDFQVIGSEGTTDIKRFRENKNHVMERPYKIEDMEYFFKTINKLKEAKFPRNKLRKFYDLKMAGNNNIEHFFEFVTLAGKLDPKPKKVLIETWLKDIKLDLDLESEFVTPLEDTLKNIFDVIEVYDFFKELKEEVNDAN